MKCDALRADLVAGKLRPLYVVVGEEPFYRDEAQALLREFVLADGPTDFNFERLESDASPGALLDSLNTLPVMAPYRLVVLREPEAGRGSKAPLTDALASWASEKRPEFVEVGGVVLAVVAAKLDKRTRWVKQLGTAGRVECDPPRGTREIGAFVKQEAKRQGVAIERGVAELLAERVGPQLLLLRQEIAKAALYAGPGEAVTRAHGAAGTPDISEEPIWDLTDAIGDGRAADALSVLSKLQRAGAPAPVLLGALVSHFRRLVRVRHGTPVPGPPFVKKKLDGQARRYSAARLNSCMRAIHETDLAIKGSGALRPEAALERLVIGLAG